MRRRERFNPGSLVVLKAGGTLWAQATPGKEYDSSGLAGYQLSDSIMHVAYSQPATVIYWSGLSPKTSPWAAMYIMTLGGMMGWVYVDTVR